MSAEATSNGGAGGASWLAEADLVDRAVYTAVARTPTPRLDSAMRRLSAAADYSRLSLACSAALVLAGGARGRRAAAAGLLAVGVTATAVNVLLKPLGRRQRPDREAAEVPSPRHVPMPISRSFPSGHTAAAVAFASGAGSVLPAVSVPLHVLAGLVGYSRIHTGVHYPGDVVAGAVLGAVVADGTTAVLARRWRHEQDRRTPSGEEPA